MSGNAVLPFYGHGPRAGDMRVLSNFHIMKSGFVLSFPDWMPGVEALKSQRLQTDVKVHSSEQAIMLCKACMMGDFCILEKIAAESRPAVAKMLGRQVSPFDDAVWKANVHAVAEHVLFQKFSSSVDLSKKLLSTGGKTLAEASKRDKIWGIGLGMEDPNVQDVYRWKGLNVLGSSLMKVREMLEVSGDF